MLEPILLYHSLLYMVKKCVILSYIRIEYAREPEVSLRCSFQRSCMEDRNQEIIKYLQREDVQARILQSIYRGRAEATVTISSAAHLFGFSENQLRDWDEKGLLKTQRPSLEFPQDGKNTKRRQYAPAELDKLAFICELMATAFSPGTIPLNADPRCERLRS